MSEKNDDIPDNFNIFPGNWTVETQELLKSFELSFRQQWDPTKFSWEELDADNFDGRQGFAQAYWFAKLSFFEKSGIGAFGLGMVRAAELDLEDHAKKTLSSITFDQCRHDEVCRRACSKLCPGFPYEYKPRSDLEEKALQNVMAIYENGKRYWKGFLQAWQRYRPEMVYGGFFFAEIGAELIFAEMRNKSRLNIYRDTFTNIARDESRHLLGTLALMKMAAGKLSDTERLQLSRLLKQGFIFLSPLLYLPQRQFWHLPEHFEEVDRKMEELAYGAGLGTLKLEEKVNSWRRAIEKKRREIEEVGLQLPSIPEIGLEGIPVTVKPTERIMGTF